MIFVGHQSKFRKVAVCFDFEFWRKITGRNWSYSWEKSAIGWHTTVRQFLSMAREILHRIDTRWTVGGRRACLLNENVFVPIKEVILNGT